MNLQMPRHVIDRNKLGKLESKAYRDSYLHTQVRSWIGYQLQALRKKFNLSQAQMAERTGKAQSVISRLENPEYGRVSVQTLLDVASSLDVALIVQFVSYPEFLARTGDKSERAMQPHTIFESIIVSDAARVAGDQGFNRTPWTVRQVSAQGSLPAVLSSRVSGGQINQVERRVASAARSAPDLRSAAA